jgi:hypothetical protein
MSELIIPNELIMKIIKKTDKNFIHKWRQLSKTCKNIVDSYTLNYPSKLYKKYKYQCNCIVTNYLNIECPYYFLVIVFYGYSTCYHNELYQYAKKKNHQGLLKWLIHIYNENDLEELFEIKNKKKNNNNNSMLGLAFIMKK